MARNAKQKRTSDSEIDSDEEIWKTIRHLDPDRGLRNLASPLKLMSTGK
jgi:hypothetical protein